MGRLGGIPDELFIELRDGEYVALPGGEEVQASAHRTAVEAYLATVPDATLDEIVRATSIVRSSVQTALAHLSHHSVDRVERTGAGRRGDPYRYRLRPLSAENPAPDEAGTDPSEAFSAETAEDPTPATHGHFSAPFRAQEGFFADGLSAAGESLPKTPSEYPRARTADAGSGLVDAARSVFAGMLEDEGWSDAP